MAFVQVNSSTGNTTGTWTLAFSGAVTAGNILILAYRTGLDLTVQPPTVSDSVNGSWSQIKWVHEATDGHSLVLACFPNTAAGTPTVTLVQGTTGAVSARGIVAEYGGLAAAPVDQFPTMLDRGSVASPASPSATTTQASETLIAVVSNGNGNQINDNASGSNPSSGWTNRRKVDEKISLSDNAVSSTGTYNETWNFGVTGTTADPCAVGILTLKAPGGAPPAITGNTLPMMGVA